MCIFCKIEPKKIILSTAKSFVLVKKFPLGKISFLCVPRTHVRSITELSLEEKTDLFLLLADLTARVKRIMNPEGLYVFIEEGSIAGQTTEHLQINLVVREQGDNFKSHECFDEIVAMTNEEIAEIKMNILKAGRY